jgi:hypothetical protein
MVSQFGLKTVEAWQHMVNVASSRRSHRSEGKDGQFDGVECSIVEVRPNYYYVVVVFILSHMDILVFYFSL